MRQLLIKEIEKLLDKHFLPIMNDLKDIRKSIQSIEIDLILTDAILDCIENKFDNIENKI